MRADQTGTSKDKLEPVSLSCHLQATNFDTVWRAGEAGALCHGTASHLAQELKKLKLEIRQELEKPLAGSYSHQQVQKSVWAVTVPDGPEWIFWAWTEYGCCFTLSSESHTKFLMAQANLKLDREGNSQNFVDCWTCHSTSLAHLLSKGDGKIAPSPKGKDVWIMCYAISARSPDVVHCELVTQELEKYMIWSSYLYLTHVFTTYSHGISKYTPPFKRRN